MNVFNNMKIETKLVGGFLVVVAIMVVLGLIGLWQLNAINQNMVEIDTNIMPGIEAVGQINTFTTDYRGQQFEHLTTQSESEMAAVEATIADDGRQIKELLATYKTTYVYNAEEQAILDKVTASWNAYLQQTSGFPALSRANKDTEAHAILNGQAEATYNELSKNTDEWVTWNHQLSNKTTLESNTVYETGRNLMIGVLIFAALLALGIGVFLGRSITTPLQQAVAMIQEMGLGHLSGRLNLDRKDEIGTLARILDQFAKDLQNEVVGVMKKVAEGDLNFQVRQRDNQDEIGPALLQMQTSLQGLMSEVNKLTQTAVEGKLSIRGDALKFKGSYHEIVQGVNNTLDAIIGPLNMATNYLDKVAGGVIPAPITETYNGDFNTLKNNLNRMSDRIRLMLTSINDATSNLSSATAEILAATTQQAAGASEQSAAISQTATTVEEVKASAEQASLRAQDVATASQRTVEVARAGTTSIQATIESMGMIKERVEGISENLLALSDQTQQIGEIISTVNEIASQSNMLALNAAVEAARAGEQGKGFAVVATEVRSLAEQSRQATEQIKAILSEIQKATNSTVMATEEGVKGVDRGVQLSAQSRESIEQLSAVINESAQVAAQVVASGQQQQSGIDQVALAMQSINQVTMQSMTSTRQTEKSAQNLNELARKMSEILAQYRY